MVLNVRARRRTSGGPCPVAERVSSAPPPSLLRRRVQGGQRPAHPPREHDRGDGRRQQAYRRHRDQPCPEHAQAAVELAGRAGEHHAPRPAGRSWCHPRSTMTRSSPPRVGDGHASPPRWRRTAGDGARRTGRILPPSRPPKRPTSWAVRVEDPDLVTGRARVSAQSASRTGRGSCGCLRLCSPPPLPAPART